MLPGPVLVMFENALVDALQNETLDEIVRRRLDQRPDNIAVGSSFAARVASVVRWAEQQGRIQDLLDAACDAAPGNAGLQGVRPYVMLFVDSIEHLPEPFASETKRGLRASPVANPKTLDALEARLAPILGPVIPRTSNPDARINTTFDALNRVPKLEGSGIPLAIWLTGALECGGPAPVINRALVRLQQSDAGFTPIATEKVSQVLRRRDGREEKIIHQDDMLPFSFLARGVEAGRSVCRLVVPQYRRGQLQPDLNGRTRHTSGSGWLVSDDLVITNHHVVNYRDGDTDALEDDLRLQAAHAVVQFDFDGPGAQPEDIPVSEIVAWSSHLGSLDYAILRLARKVRGRRPLGIVTALFYVDDDEAARPAVNIIQHPRRQHANGQTTYKMVACRNNLVLRTDGTELWYFTDTLDASSGSPVCNDEWRVVALHKRWHPVEGVSYQGKATGVINVGTQIAAILADLRARAEYQDLLQEILHVQAAETSEPSP